MAVLFALFVAVAAFGIAAFRLTFHVIGINPGELASWWALFRSKPDADPE